VASVYEFNYKNKSIFCLDLSGLKLPDKSKFVKLVEEAKEKIETHPPKSLLVITKVNNTGFDTEIASTIAEYASHNTPYVKASAIVGIAGLQKIILTAIKTITKRDFYLADTMEEAQEWLVNQ
jgi:hypothetical protein